MFNGKNGETHTRFDIQFFKEVIAVGINGTGADMHFFRNLFIGFIAAYPLQEYGFILC